jgi:hypothetical protein
MSQLCMFATVTARIAAAKAEDLEIISEHSFSPSGNAGERRNALSL